MAQYRYLSEQDIKQLENWWHWLDDNRGDRAMLRRVESPDDALLLPAFSHFLQRMPPRWSEGGIALPLTDAAMVASVIARVKKQASTTFAKALALPKDGGKATMSELRFQQLQKSRSEEEFFRRLIRAVDLLNGKANIADLANSILHWLHEFRTVPASKPEQRLAVRWATDYYSAFKD